MDDEERSLALLDGERTGSKSFGQPRVRDTAGVAKDAVVLSLNLKTGL
ncbi:MULTISPECIES: hypothetical protein [unclassified Streptomyces]|nr:MULTISPECIES: hypothetical protein [unclassified Streptomyces]